MCPTVAVLTPDPALSNKIMTKPTLVQHPQYRISPNDKGETSHNTESGRREIVESQAIPPPPQLTKVPPPPQLVQAFHFVFTLSPHHHHTTHHHHHHHHHHPPPQPKKQQPRPAASAAKRPVRPSLHPHHSAPEQHRPWLCIGTCKCLERDSSSSSSSSSSMCRMQNTDMDSAPDMTWHGRQGMARPVVMAFPGLI